MRDTSLSEKVVRRELKKVFLAAMRKERLGPRPVQGFKTWLEGRGYTMVEKGLVEQYTMVMVQDMERRVKQIKERLREEVFHRNGGS